MNWTNGLRTKPRRKTVRSASEARRPTAQEHGDAMPLDEFLAMVGRVGIASEGYRKGYEHGFLGATMPGRWEPDYKRGVYNGEAARKRGAHGNPRSGGGR